MCDYHILSSGLFNRYLHNLKSTRVTMYPENMQKRHLKGGITEVYGHY